MVIKDIEVGDLSRDIKAHYEEGRLRLVIILEHDYYTDFVLDL